MSRMSKLPAVAGTLAAVALGSHLATAKEIETDDVRITAAGNRAGRASTTPWSGIWWPLASTKLAKGWNGTSDDFAYVSSNWQRQNANKPVNDLSPLLKYDEYVKRTTGTDPGSALLECTGDKTKNFQHNVYGADKERYDKEGISYGWWGHCNGWSAAACLEREPIAPVEASGIRFDVADLKGLLTESFYSVESDFTGLRYDAPPANIRDSVQPQKDLLAALNSGSPKPVADYIAWYEKAWGTTMTAAAKASAKAADFKDELELFQKWYKEEYEDAYADVKPEVFHKILETVIGRKKLAFVCDVTANDEVWNHPIYSYDSTITKSRDFTEANAARTEWNVRTVCHYVTDGVDESSIGASDFTRTYTYTLVTDSTGKLLRGEWTGSSKDDHPDFCWLPISNPTGADNGENYKLLWGKIQELLPANHAATEARAIDLSVNGTLASSRRLPDESTTWQQPVAATGNVALAIAVAPGRTVTTVKYFQETVTGYSDPEATRDPLVALGESSTGPSFGISKTFTGSGKKMVLALAYDAANKLVAWDEITIDYSGSNTPTPTSDDTYEENDTKATAKTIAAGSFANLVCNDDDWFAVTLATSGKLDVKIAFQHSAGDLDMVVESASGQVGSSTGTTNEEKVTKDGLAAGTYYVHVFGYSGAKGKYSLTVTTTAGTATTPTEDALEPNNDRATAKAITAGAQDLWSNDEDWFAVTLNTTGSIEVKIDFKNSESDLDLYLVNASGTELQKSDSTADSETVKATGLAAGTYYVQVKKYSGGAAKYKLTLTTAGSTTPTTRTGTVTANSLNVRSGPGTTYGVVRTISNGLVVTILEERSGFYKITWSGAPTTGELWASKTYIRVN